MKHEVRCLDPGQLELFLERRRRSRDEGDSLSDETSLGANLIAILDKANELVPSDAGSLLLDDPTVKVGARSANELTFIAAFGEKADLLIGRKIKAAEGIAGRVYLTGETHQAGDAHKDRFFHSGVDEATEFETKALVAIPIKLGDEVCGVLELIRDDPYGETDCELLNIFAGYLSVSIQNVLDARAAQLLARRDNLTGLFNDRYLHVALEESILGCLADGTDLSLLFLDLDFFKRVNDDHGHLTGSQVLREIGGLLYRASQSLNGIPCRYGGDEFVLILPHTELADAIDLAENIRLTIVSTPFCKRPGTIQPQVLNLKGLTCSIGVASLRRHLPDEPRTYAKTTLLHLADAAMYVAKETGRNRTVVAGEPVRRRSRADHGFDREDPRAGAVRGDTPEQS